ncbi:hypothetical protein RHEph03_gp012 [Rhizobium phage RHEph03]|uniref:Uncharacterized protein n=2 Tax=Cuernavacavirus RHEph02 TaxID=2733899 RepID=L7TMU2_9CAUD|nr:hypothetical protein HOS21_gp12 [Rhizobium phage RHEph02]AGC35579.1 hypothetical protein RHEph02_gp012 [Rhizobium phage RHEph02]AGC35639.1 hypothetical protein RHEph03_gp012 [Rhizobium phage RHEph03]
MRISRVQGSVQVRVSFAEEDWRTAERSAYYTDCVEDAAIEGAKMRKKKGYPYEVRNQEGSIRDCNAGNAAAIRRWIATQARQDARRARSTSI